MRTLRRAAAALALTAVLVGCSAPEPDPPATTTPPPVTAPPATPGAPADAAEQVCADSPAITTAVERVHTAAEQGPVLPAAVALLLLAPRDRASVQVTDPDLAAALEELVAAIDDVDAQGNAALPAGGNSVEDAVPVDTARLVAAAQDLAAACAQR